jgi:hypothetical protein
MEKDIVPFLQQMKDARKEMKDPFFCYQPMAKRSVNKQQHFWHCHLEEVFSQFFPGDAWVLKVICYILELYGSR